MKKWLCFVLCFGMAIGASGCGGSEEETSAEVQLNQTEETEKEENDVFDFTIDEFVQSVDERLGKMERKLLSEYELVDDGTKRMYKLTDTTALMAEINEDSSKVEGFIFYATVDYLSGEDSDNYAFLLLNSIVVIDPYDMKQIYEELNLESTEEGIYFSEGTNAKYIYEVKDGIAKVSAIPSSAF